MLLSNIRPSFYRDKCDAPTLAHYDDSVKASSTFLKSTMKRSSSSTPLFLSSIENSKRISQGEKSESWKNCSPGGSKEEPVVVKFKTAVGLEAFGTPYTPHTINRKSQRFV